MITGAKEAKGVAREAVFIADRVGDLKKRGATIGSGSVHCIYKFFRSHGRV